MSDDITGDLDLLGDWLDAKGYTEEAGLCTRAMDEINKLRAALKPLANAKSANTYGGDTGLYFIDPADRRAAAAALKETWDD